VGEHGCGVGQMHQQQAADCGIEGLRANEGAGIALAEVDVAEAEVVPSPCRHGDLRLVLLDADHGTRRTDDLGDLKGHVARAAPKVEDSHAGLDSAAHKKRRCRFGYDCRLRLQSLDFGVFATQDVL